MGYFEELSLERLLDIIEFEQAEGVFVSFGGQSAQNLVSGLEAAGVRIMGTPAVKIDEAEDRGQHSAMLDSIGAGQPAWTEANNVDVAAAWADHVGYPVLVRPSYVLSGAAFGVASDRQSLENFIRAAQGEVPDRDREGSIVCSHFIGGAMEIDIDLVANDGRVLAHAISKHVEKGGVHSGDATL